MNLEHITSTHKLIDAYEELDDLPINPPGAYYTDEDVQLGKVDILNWYKGNSYTFRPRLRDKLQEVRRLQAVEEGDEEYDCD